MQYRNNSLQNLQILIFITKVRMQREESGFFPVSKTESGQKDPAFNPETPAETKAMRGFRKKHYPKIIKKKE